VKFSLQPNSPAFETEHIQCCQKAVYSVSKPAQGHWKQKRSDKDLEVYPVAFKIAQMTLDAGTESSHNS